MLYICNMDLIYKLYKNNELNEKLIRNIIENVSKTTLNEYIDNIQDKHFKFLMQYLNITFNNGK